MKLGIKVGPQKESFLDLQQTNSPFTEVWFNVNKLDDYTQLFDQLKKRNIEVGLHFWCVTQDHTQANIAYPDTDLMRYSLERMKKTIDVAANNGFRYVVIHPGSRAIVKLYLDREEFVPASDPVDLETSQQLLIENVATLSLYAKERGIVAITETVPRKTAANLLSKGRAARLNAVEIYELPVQSLIELSTHGYWIANDFCHSASNCISTNSRDVWQFLRTSTAQLAPRTKLIHLGFVVPPYNGTDFHDMLNNPILNTDKAVPNRKQMIELLQLFSKQQDIWILVEPQSDHIKNYFLAQKILKEAGF